MILLASLLALSAAAPPTLLSVGGGRHPVGMTTLAPSVTVWYPARGTGAPLRYRDYVELALRDAGPGPDGKPRTMEAYAGFLASNGIAADAIEAWLSSPMGASRDAPPATGRFPVVLIAPGNGGAAHDEAVLGAFLASHGSVVATTSSPGWRGRDMTSDADVLPVAREQAAALAAALDRVRALPHADGGRWAAVGYSFGARAALLLAAERPGMRALVSLAGGIGSAEAKDWLPAGALDRVALVTPILHLYDDSDERVPPDFTLLDSLRRAPQTRTRVPGLGHFDLITYGLASARLPGLGGPEAAARLARIERVLEATRAFLAAHLGAPAPGRPRAPRSGAGR